MPNTHLIYLTVKAMLEPILLSATFAIIVTGGTYLYVRGTESCTIAFLSRVAGYYFSFGVPIALLAYVTGYLTSISRVAAVGAVLPAIIALIGGLNIYVFGSDSKYKLVVGFCVCVFTVALFYGIQRGALERESGREARLLRLSEQERRVRNYREYRSLPSELPAWITTGEPK